MQKKINIKKLNNKPLYEGRSFRLNLESYQQIITDLNDQEVGRVDIERGIVRHNGASIVVAINNDEKLLLIKQYRYPIDKLNFEFVCGGIEKGSDPLETAARELQEEGGVIAGKLEYVSELIPSPGFCDEIQYLFLARDLSPSSLPLDEDEFIEVCYFSLSEIEEMIRTGLILDAKSIAALYILKAKGLI